jgi:hypothetical protein
MYRELVAGLVEEIEADTTHAGWQALSADRPRARHDPGARRGLGARVAEGTLWVGQYRDRKIHQVDPETGAILRTIETLEMPPGAGVSGLESDGDQFFCGEEGAGR